MTVFDRVGVALKARSLDFCEPLVKGAVFGGWGFPDVGDEMCEVEKIPKKKFEVGVCMFALLMEVSVGCNWNRPSKRFSLDRPVLQAVKQ